MINLLFYSTTAKLERRVMDNLQATFLDVIFQDNVLKFCSENKPINYPNDYS